MKKLLISGIIALFAMQLVQAATICDAKVGLAEARLNLMMMVMSTDKAEHNALKVDIDTASTALEMAMTAMLKDENKTDDAQLTNLQSTWAAFKNTRETEIIPAVRAGDRNKGSLLPRRPGWRSGQVRLQRRKCGSKRSFMAS